MKNTEPRKKFNFLKISLYFFYLIFVLAIILLLLINKKTNVNCLVVIAALIVFVIINLIIHHTLLKNISSAYDEIDESHKMQSTFFSNLTHNLNTPLNVILTLDEIIIRNSDSEEIKN